jgi:hypothetical protein
MSTENPTGKQHGLTVLADAMEVVVIALTIVCIQPKNGKLKWIQNEVRVMKDRSKGFLREELIDHDGEQFDYINELHGLLWRFVKTVNPGAFGNLSYHVDDALAIAEARKAFRDQLKKTALDRLVKMREAREHV